MSEEALGKYIAEHFEDDFTKPLQGFIQIENTTPGNETGWEEPGSNLNKAYKYIQDRVYNAGLKDIINKDKKDPGHAGIIIAEVPAFNTESTNVVMIYGHYDKVPSTPADWGETGGPYEGKITEGRLYGRGGADDGYSSIGSVLAVKALQETGLSHCKIIFLFEGNEETSEDDIRYYITTYREEIGDVNFLFNLDCLGNDEKTLWI